MPTIHNFFLIADISIDLKACVTVLELVKHLIDGAVTCAVIIRPFSLQNSFKLQSHFK